MIAIKEQALKAWQVLMMFWRFTPLKLSSSKDIARHSELACWDIRHPSYCLVLRVLILLLPIWFGSPKSRCQQSSEYWLDDSYQNLLLSHYVLNSQKLLTHHFDCRHAYCSCISNVHNWFVRWSLTSKFDATGLLFDYLV